MIKIESLSFHYKTAPIFENFNLEICKGESWAVLGPSGCGKSTLLALLAGLRLPSSGNVIINDQVLTRPRPQTGLILQDYGLLPWATVQQNVALGLELRKFYGADGVHAPLSLPVITGVRDWLERLGLSAVADKYPSQISGGQRQRTAIARTLVLKPDLLLMDEPFSSLDTPTRESLQNLTLELVAEQDITLVVVTHSIEESALLGRKILLLGEPPSCAAHIINNPNTGSPNYRESADYLDLIKKLRDLMQINKDFVV
jgi:ABC-type nitrate/sulfonate/bicarbonate transport system ATPase subunit